MDISVIVPTLNRASSLEITLKSICEQTLSSDRYEVIVVDNGSTDDTKVVTRQFSRLYSNVRYVLEPKIGLLHSRHRGVRESGSSNILVFIDDDITVERDYLYNIFNTFKDHDDVALVGGKASPLFEIAPPYWIKAFEVTRGENNMFCFLGLIDLGNSAHYISGDKVYGCNFSIKKEVLLQCGGFNPDGVPPDMLKYRGDGEIALGRKVEKSGYKVFYNPSILVRHRIPASRLAIEYFIKRAYMEGVSWSFENVRKKGKSTTYVTTEIYYLVYLMGLIPFGVYKLGFRRLGLFPVYYKVMINFFKGYRFHRMEILRDPELLKYVLQSAFMNSQ